MEQKVPTVKDLFRRLHKRSGETTSFEDAWKNIKKTDNEGWISEIQVWRKDIIRAVKAQR